MGKDNMEEEKKHAFWSTQPMPHGGSRAELPEGPIVEINNNANTAAGAVAAAAQEGSDASGGSTNSIAITEIRATPYHMPSGFEWGLVNVQNASELNELYKLLTNNYVEDDDALFRFDYSPEFLLWALTPPGYHSDYLVGVFSSTTKKLVAFISAIPATVQVYERRVDVVEINFLCVHKKLRSKRLAPVLIKEITRRANVRGIFQAVYTAGMVLPVPVSSARYYHRSLNPRKLVQVGFSRIPANGRTTMARLCKLYALPDRPTAIPHLRPMTEEDIPGVVALLTTYLSKFQLKVLYTEEDVRHWFFPRDKVIYSYVAAAAVDDDKDCGATIEKKEDDGAAASSEATEQQPTSSSPSSTQQSTATTEATPSSKKKKMRITDLISFYHLPSSILRHDKETLFAAYSYYNVATSVPLVDLMKDALILAKQTGADVYNALDLMDNDPVMIFEPLKFGIGDGQLQYYIYNWSCPEMTSNQVGLVLL